MVPVFQHGPVELKGDGIPPPPDRLEHSLVVWPRIHWCSLNSLSKWATGWLLQWGLRKSPEWGLRKRLAPATRKPGVILQGVLLHIWPSDLKGKGNFHFYTENSFPLLLPLFSSQELWILSQVGTVRRAGKKLWTSSALFSFPPRPLQRLSTVSCAELLQSCPTLDPMGHSRQGSSVWGILQARILERVAMPSSRDLPDPGIEPASLRSPALAGRFFTTSTTWEAVQHPNWPLSAKRKMHMVNPGPWTSWVFLSVLI